MDTKEIRRTICQNLFWTERSVDGGPGSRESNESEAGLVWKSEERYLVNAQWRAESHRFLRSKTR